MNDKYGLKENLEKFSWNEIVSGKPEQHAQEVKPKPEPKKKPKKNDNQGSLF